MPVVAPPTLTAAGLSPDRADRATFVARSIARDDFIKNTQIPQLQTAIDNVYINAVDAYNQAFAARNDSISAATSASQAASAATAIQWVSGTTYAVGDARWSPATKISYRRLIAGAGTTDPSADATNWAAIVMPMAGGGTGATTAAAARLALGVAPNLQSIAATVASNALTVTLNPTTLDFRSATLTTGVPNARTIASALTLVAPSGASFGAVNAAVARLILLAIDNAGTPELALINLAGGVNLNEEGLITTVAISAASTSATTAYSTTARTAVPYRVVGAIDLTEATAGVYATAPSLVQPMGGEAITAMSSFGMGQTMQDVTGSRSNGTTYYNTTSKPILVIVHMASTSATSGAINILHTINGLAGITQYAFSNAVGYGINDVFVVPPGQSYRVNIGGVPTVALDSWQELR